jgi:hypothetical protein
MGAQRALRVGTVHEDYIKVSAAFLFNVCTGEGSHAR